MATKTLTQQGLSRRPPVDEIVAGCRTKADKIRALSRAGYSRAEIARELDIRYQHVRNVLVDDERVAGRAATVASHPTSRSEKDAPESHHPYPAKTKLEADGRVAIPQAFWRAAGLTVGDSVMISVEGDVIRLMSLPASIRRAQELVRRLVPEGVSLVDELLAERRAEARREDGDA